MHPMLMMALADEAQRERRSEREKLEVRSLAFGDRNRGFGGLRPVRGPVRRLVVGLSLRPRPS